MNLDFRMKRQKPIPRARTHTQKIKDKMNWIVKKYRTGELDLSKPSHRIPARVAVSKGLIPKEALDNGKGN